MALIELDRPAPAGPPPGPIPPPPRYRTAGLLLTALLLAALGGATAPGALHWRYHGVLPVGAPEASVQLDGDRAYAVARSGPQWLVTAWRLDRPPARLWTAPVAATRAGPDQADPRVPRVRRAGDVVLVSDGVATGAVDERTGRARWRSPIPVRPLPGDRTGLAQDPQFRPGTGYDQDSGEPGPLYFTASGQPHTEPPVRTELRGVDLRTGTTRWTAAEAGAVDVLPAAAGLLVLTADRLRLRSADTGAVLREAPLPAIGGHRPTSGQLVGELLLVTYGEVDSADRRVVGYAADTLRPRWSRPAAEALVPGQCAGMICLDEASGRAVLDPATGRTRWTAPTGMDLQRYGADVVERAGSPGPPVRLVDAVTGDQRLTLAGWRGDVTGWPADVAGGDGGPVLVRSTAATGPSRFAVAGGNPPAVRVLGATRGPVAECAADERFVVCRAARQWQVFAYRD